MGTIMTPEQMMMLAERLQNKWWRWIGTGCDELTAADLIRQMAAPPAPQPARELPPLPSHPEHVYVWTDAEKEALRDYARATLAAYCIRSEE